MRKAFHLRQPSPPVTIRRADMDQTQKRTDEPAGNAILRLLSSPRKFFLLLAVYFAAQVCLRLVTSNTTDLDESEQLLTTQQLQWGYGPQPPLYTWLQFPFVQLFGLNILSLALFKNLLLFGIYVLTYLNARFITRDHLRSVVAAVSLLFMPQIAWESQRDLTHSVLVTFFAAATFYVFLKLTQSRQLRWYVAFGICIALGLLSKYSFAVFLAGLMLGALTIPSLRPVILNPGILLSLLIGMALITPHVVWAREHVEWVTSTVRKLGMHAERPWLKIVFPGTGHLLLAIVSHVGVPLAIYAAICWRHRSGAVPAALGDTARVIGRALAVMFVLLLAGIFCFKVTGFKDRWMLPLCVWLPILLVAGLAPRLDSTRMTWLIGIAGGAAAIILILIPTRVRFAEQFRVKQVLNAPYEELATEIRHGTVPNGCLVVNDNWVGGNLKLRFPDRWVLSSRLWLRHQVTPGDDCLLIWDATERASPPVRLLNFTREFAEVDLSSIRYVEAPLKFYQTNRMRLGLAMGRINPNPPLTFTNVPGDP
jgi:lipopolysaccharide core galacturonosyltransferase RgtB